jgi:hypothetical protein
VIEEQVRKELVSTDLQPDLLADKGEALSQLQQELLDVLNQLRFELAFVAPVRHCDEVEDVRIFGHLLGKVGVRRRQGRREVGDRLATAFVEFRLDVVDQYRPRPAVFDGGCGVPEAGFGVIELVE